MKNMTTTRSFLAALAAIVLTLTLAPLTAQAAGNVKAIQLGAGVLVGPKEKTDASGRYYEPGSYVWFGANGAPGKPIKWRVLDAANANDGRTAGMFLLSEHLLASGVSFQASYHYVSSECHRGPHTDDHTDCVTANVYQGSDAQEWCKGFASKTSNFSEAEQGAMLGVAKKDGDENDLYGLSWKTSELTTKDKMFFLSVRELADHVGNYDKAPGLAASFDDGSAGAWWLRSPYANDTIGAGMVYEDGRVNHDNVSHARAVRPAFNLDLGSVLFTSAAVGGKISGAAGADALEEVGKNAGNEWKVTLKDDSRVNFSASMTAASEKEVTFSWEGAKTGRDEWISAVITDADGNVKYYGRVAQAEKASGTATVELPAGLSATDRLCVFNEQYNGDKKTDYASPLVVMAGIATPSPLPDGTVGAKYSQKLEATGLTAPLEWKLAKKTKKDRLPAGLKLSRAGKISGTPREAGTFAFTVQVTDASGKSATKALLLTVEEGGGPAAPEGLVATPPTAQGMTDGTISGVDPTMEWSADGGETWTDCPATGPITGLAPGDYLVRYKATEKAGPGDAATVTVPESGAHVVEIRLIDGGDGGPVVVLELTSDGGPVAGMDLWAWLVPADGGAEQGAFLGTTDEAGRLVIDVDALVWATGDHAGEKASITAGTWRIRIEIHDADGELWTGVTPDGVSLPATSTRSGGGGCFNVGFGGLAMIACAALILRRRS